VSRGEGGRTKMGCGGGGKIMGGGGGCGWKLYRLSGEGVIDLGLNDLRLGQRHGLGLRLRLRLWLREGLMQEKRREGWWAKSLT